MPWLPITAFVPELLILCYGSGNADPLQKDIEVLTVYYL